MLDRILNIASHVLPDAGVNCMLIGGFAVNYYGYTRNTLDVDFMIIGDQLDLVKSIMLNAGFTNMTIGENASFFSAPDSNFRVDFLQVDMETMNKLQSNAVTASIHGYKINVPSLKDLLAMKIFSLSQQESRRLAKDLPDIAYLTVLNQLDLESDLRPLCNKYGTQNIYKQIRLQVNLLNDVE